MASKRRPKKKETRTPEGLDALRARIDRVDSEILELLDERARIATAVGEEKRRLFAAGGRGQEKTGPGFYDPEREQRVFRRLLELKKGKGESPFPSASVPFVFREVISACRSLEAAMRIAFLGPEGTFTQMAARQTFGSSVEYVESPTISGVFEAVFRGQADYGVVPFENSAEGGVLQTLDCLLETDLRIRGELQLRIDHFLLARKGTQISDLRKVHSHPAAIAQCAQWLAKNLPGVPAAAAPSTAAAARAAAQAREPGEGAIASHAAAEAFGLGVLRERIQDQGDNATRFIILAPSDGPVTGDDRTSVIASLKDDRDLVKVLKAFEGERIRVSRVESRASVQRSWHYHYFLDFAGHRSAPAVARALRKITALCENLRVLGSYPRFRAVEGAPSRL